MKNSNGSRWMVDTTCTDDVPFSDFDFELNYMIAGNLYGAVLDLIIELVAEIERLQTWMLIGADYSNRRGMPTETERILFARLWALTGLHGSTADTWNDKEQMMQQRIDELERENANLRACANIDEALRPADGDTKWAERFKGLYGEGHYEPE